MGKPFTQELETVSDTYSFSKDIDISKIDKYIQENILFPFLVVGSGGSFSVALACALLIESFGGFAKATTPYELMNSLSGLYHYNIMFFSASGSNSDIINAYNFCKQNEARSTFILCLKESSKLVNEAITKYNDDKYLEVTLPHGKDGFLAVNSSVCALGIFEKVFCSTNNTNSSAFENIAKPLSDDTIKCLSAHTIIALGGRWTMPVISDFESKCIEAGLINVMPADLRNFAHGRHHWIAKNPDTSIICFVTQDEQELAEKTMNLLPTSVCKSIIVSSCNGISATIELFTQMFLIVQKLGEKRRIDPGKPGVPAYGSKLYHLSYNMLSKTKSMPEYSNDILSRTSIRKIRSIDGLPIEKHVEIKDSAKQFLLKLSKAVFRGIVLDYDNTIIRQNNVKDSIYLSCINYIKAFTENGIKICFATGRGKSIRDQLIDFIPEPLQEMVFICYYNGTNIIPLTATPKSATDNIDPILQDISEILKKDIAYSDIRQSLRNTNISIEGNTRALNRVYSLLNRKILENELQNVKLTKSDHSIDVTLSSISKDNAVLFLKEKCHGDVLCIGDAGDELGNDYTLLNNEYSLSVDSVSTSMKTCWNIASLGLRGPIATLEYFSKLQILKNGLKFRKSYLKI